MQFGESDKISAFVGDNELDSSIFNTSGSGETIFGNESLVLEFENEQQVTMVQLNVSENVNTVRIDYKLDDEIVVSKSYTHTHTHTHTHICSLSQNRVAFSMTSVCIPPLQVTFYKNYATLMYFYKNLSQAPRL